MLTLHRAAPVQAGVRFYSLRTYALGKGDDAQRVETTHSTAAPVPVRYPYRRRSRPCGFPPPFWCRLLVQAPQRTLAAFWPPASRDPKFGIGTRIVNHRWSPHPDYAY
jgi:hypothetical protein